MAGLVPAIHVFGTAHQFMTDDAFAGD